jgi:Competence protein CoiA-like family
MPRHSRDDRIAQTGDPQQIYARDVRLPPDAPLFRLERGGAPAVRADARAGHLICPVPGCEAPAYTTRGGSRRDHFAHLRLAGAGHAPETFFHFVAKQLLGEWLRSRYPIAHVVVDHQAVENRQVPDVLCTFPDGRRFAFEVQYAALTEADWEKRHHGYALQEIVDVWLFGHIRRYLRPDRYGDRFRVVPVMRRAIESGAPVYWLNPDERSIGTRRDLTDSMRREGYFGEMILDHGIEIGWDELTGTTIDDVELLTRVGRQERAARPAIEAARRRELDAEERYAREEAERRERYGTIQGWIVRKQERQAQEYAINVRPWVVRDFASEIEDIELELPTDRGIWLHPATWHAILFRDRIRGRVGQAFPFVEMCRPFFQSTRDKSGLWEAVTEYLFHLYRRGYIRVEARSHHIGDEILVVADTFDDARRLRGW